MKFSSKQPFIHTNTKQYYEHKQLRDLQAEFDKILLMRKVVDSYKPKKPKK